MYPVFMLQTGHRFSYSSIKLPLGLCRNHLLVSANLFIFAVLFSVVITSHSASSWQCCRLCWTIVSSAMLICLAGDVNMMAARPSS